jgi:MscS family membrane protein
MALGILEVSLFTNIPQLQHWYNASLTYIGNKWLLALITLIIFYILSEVFILFVEYFVLRLTAKTKTEVDDKIVHAAKRPFSLILLMVGIKVALMPLELQGIIALIFARITTSLIIIFLTVKITRVSKILIENWGHAWARRTKSSIDDALVPLFRRISSIVLWLLGIMSILSLWGVDIGGLLAGLGVAGIAIGFAVKDSLGNIFGGISLILDRAIKVGDVIKLSTNEEGTVVDVGLRSTRIRTWDNELIIIPNGQLANVTFHNYKLPDLSGRVVIPIHVAYGSNPDKVKKVVLDSVKGIHGLLKGDKDRVPQVRFSDMMDFSLFFKLYLWAEDISLRYKIKEEAVNSIYKALNKNKIEIPFPTRTDGKKVDNKP